MIINSLTKSLQSVKFRQFIKLIELHMTSHEEKKETVIKS